MSKNTILVDFSVKENNIEYADKVSNALLRISELFQQDTIYSHELKSQLRIVSKNRICDSIRTKEFLLAINAIVEIDNSISGLTRELLLKYFSRWIVSREFDQTDGYVSDQPIGDQIHHILSHAIPLSKPNSPELREKLCILLRTLQLSVQYKENMRRRNRDCSVDKVVEKIKKVGNVIEKPKEDKEDKPFRDRLKEATSIMKRMSHDAHNSTQYLTIQYESADLIYAIRYGNKYGVYIDNVDNVDNAENVGEISSEKILDGLKLIAKAYNELEPPI